MDINIKAYDVADIDLAQNGQPVESVSDLKTEQKYDYHYKHVDWKMLKEKWDEAPLSFKIIIKHKERTLTFISFLDKNKKCVLCVFINGGLDMTMCAHGHPYRIYMNKKLWTYKERFEGYYKKHERSYKKLGREKWLIKQGFDPYDYMPTFDNIAQIKKMVTALE